VIETMLCDSQIQ